MIPRILQVVAMTVLVIPSVAQAADTPSDVFEKRLLPIFKSPNPASCIQCHLASVDLKDYILPDHEKTFRSLRDQGLIDLNAPEKSKILKLIDMGGAAKGGAAQVQAKLRKAEHDAFAEWIKACAADLKLRSAPPLDAAERAKPAKPDEVIRHGRKDRVLESFEQNVWAMRFRCMNCHTEGTPQNEKYRKEYGERVAWVKKAGAEATMEYLISSKLVDTESPEKSPLLRKPLGEVKHEGGVKFAPGDLGHKAFRSWVEDIAAIRGGRYAKAAHLPKKDDGPQRFGTDLWLKLTDTPAAWGDKLVQVNVHAWDEKSGTWEATPVATSDRIVWGKGKLWQHNLTLLADRGSTRAKEWARKPALPPGKYLVKVYVVLDDRLKKDWKAVVGEDDFVGQVELRGRWAEGYGAMTAANASKVSR